MSSAGSKVLQIKREFLEVLDEYREIEDELQRILDEFHSELTTGGLARLAEAECLVVTLESYWPYFINREDFDEYISRQFAAIEIRRAICRHKFYH